MQHLPEIKEGVQGAVAIGLVILPSPEIDMSLESHESLKDFIWFLAQKATLKVLSCSRMAETNEHGFMGLRKVMGSLRELFIVWMTTLL